MDASQTGTKWSREYQANYTTKDLLQYALAIGCCSDPNNDEHRYTFEENPNFEAVPSFCFVLPSWASSDGSFSYVQPFPTPLMNVMGVIPSDCLKDDSGIENLPIIHISQSATWHRSLPLPFVLSGDRKVNTWVSTRVVSVTPKSIGTFVETETRIRARTELLCTLSSTLLVLGMDPSNVTPIPNATPVQNKKQMASEFETTTNSRPQFEWCYKTNSNQALLYRLASGDFNKIHVDPSTTQGIVDEPSDQPILHGLCTLGIALRGLLTMLQNKMNVVSLPTNADVIASSSATATMQSPHRVTHLFAKFTKPVFVGDILTLQVWKNKEDLNTFSFRVLNSTSGSIVLNEGVLKLQETPTTSATRSRL